MLSTICVVLLIFSLDTFVPSVFLQMPKLVHGEILQHSGMIDVSVRHGVCRESYLKLFNIFSPSNVHQSIFSEQDSSKGPFVKSGTFGFTRLIDLSLTEVAFVATGTYMEKLLFSMERWGSQLLDQIVNFVIETTDDDMRCDHLDRGKAKAVTRMLLMPSRSEASLLTRKYATGPAKAPFEALVCSDQDRLLSNFRLLHSTHAFIPRTRAPPVCFYLSIPLI